MALVLKALVEGDGDKMATSLEDGVDDAKVQVPEKNCLKNGFCMPLIHIFCVLSKIYEFLFT